MYFIPQLGRWIVSFAEALDLATTPGEYTIEDASGRVLRYFTV